MLEKHWKTSSHNDDRTTYRQACRRANKLINESRRSHNSEMINVCTDSKKRWAAIKKILHSSKRDIEESDENNKKWCQSFADYFSSKIKCIRQTMSTRLQSLTNHHFLDPLHFGLVLSQLMPVTPSHVAQILVSNNSKSSNMDFIPTSLIKVCSISVSEIIANLANLSFTQGCLQDCFKRAQITSLLKKQGLDKDFASNYRHISNLNNI